MKIGIISDIHEDIIRLIEAIQLLEKSGCSEIVCLGDIVGFTLPFYKYITTRNAEECVKVVRSNCKIVVAGNHDLFAVRRVPRIKTNFDYPSDWYDLDYRMREKLSKNKIWLYEDSELPITLSSDSKEFLSSLEEFEVTDFDGHIFFLSHFCYPDLTGSSLEFPTKFKHIEKQLLFMKEKNCITGFSGHGHPEGATVFNNNKINHLNFGKYSINQDPAWIVCPCVANTTRLNGVIVFDTSDFQLSLIPLGSAKIMN